MKKIVILPLVLGIALLGYAYGSSAHDDDDDHPPTTNIGKSAETMGQNIGQSASTMGQNAAQGAGGIVNSVGQFLQGLGTNMSQPAQKPAVETPAVEQPPAPPAAAENVRTSAETDISAGYENASEKKTDLFLSCPSCGQKFQVTGFPKGSKAYCPACGKPIEQE